MISRVSKRTADRRREKRVGNDSIEFNAKLVDPPEGVDEWPYNDYIFRVACHLSHRR